MALWVALDAGGLIVRVDDAERGALEVVTHVEELEVSAVLLMNLKPCFQRAGRRNLLWSYGGVAARSLACLLVAFEHGASRSPWWLEEAVTHCGGTFESQECSVMILLILRAVLASVSSVFGNWRDAISCPGCRGSSVQF